MIDTNPPCIAWADPPSNLSLRKDEIHVWQAYLKTDRETLCRFESTLTSDEKSRAARFLFSQDRDSFIMARGILRDLLGRYLGRPPAAIEFEYGPHGKPALHRKNSYLPIRFNLAHSHGRALYAFADQREVGIDLELIRVDFGGEAVAKRFFSMREVMELRALPQALRAQGFFICWTRKEAYVKALGGGLQIPLNSFDVSLTSGRLEQFHAARNLLWSLYSFQPAPQFVAAVMAEGRIRQLRYLDWAP